MKDIAKKWVIGMSGSEWDDVTVSFFVGTEAQVKQHLVQLVAKDRIIYFDKWDYGTESVSEVQEKGSGKFYAYGCYRDCHCDYTATLESDVYTESGEDLQEVTGIEWDTDGEGNTLPSTMYVPAQLKGDEITDFLSNKVGFCIVGIDPA